MSNQYPEPTEENICKLAQLVVNDMEVNDLMEYVFDDLVKVYDTSTELYYSDCEAYEFIENE